MCPSHIEGFDHGILQATDPFVWKIGKRLSRDELFVLRYHRIFICYKESYAFVSIRQEGVLQGGCWILNIPQCGWLNMGHFSLWNWLKVLKAFRFWCRHQESSAWHRCWVKVYKKVRIRLRSMLNLELLTYYIQRSIKEVSLSLIDCWLRIHLMALVFNLIRHAPF